MDTLGEVTPGMREKTSKSSGLRLTKPVHRYLKEVFTQSTDSGNYSLLGVSP
jgi:hypothetical protein